MIKKTHPKIIDWGLAFIQKNKQIHSFVKNRPFQFNTPFSCVLFNKTFTKDYDSYLEDIPDPSFTNIKQFVSSYLKTAIDESGEGHLELIDYIFTGSLEGNIPKYSTTNIVPEFIIMYLSNILLSYTKNGKYMETEYYNNVYLHNLDIWGFTILLVSILDMLRLNKNTLNDNEIKAHQVLKDLFTHILEQDSKKIDTIYVKDKVARLNFVSRVIHVSKPTTKNNKYSTYAQNAVNEDQ